MDKLQSIIACEPREEYFKGGIGDNIAEKPSRNAIEQHRNLMKIFEDNGCRILYINEMKNHPNSVFVRDTAVITPYGYIKVRMGLPSRRGEEEWMASFLESCGIERIGRVEGNATCEGGDVIVGKDTVFIGHSGRTNLDGVMQVKKMVEDIGYETRIAEVSEPFLHLGGMMSIVDDFILHCQHFPKNFFEGYDEIPIECNSFIGGNVIYVGDRRVIAEKRNEVAIKWLKKHGFIVYHADLSEFIKGNGGPSCLILPLEWR